MIVTKFNSGLGNQLFQYGASLALAKRTESQICADPWAFSHNVSRSATNLSTRREFELQKLEFPMHYRKIPSGWLVTVRGYPRLRNWILDSRRESYTCPGGWEPSFDELSGNVVLRGYFQDIRYMGAKADDIVSEIASKIGCTPDRQLDGALHVRRGDYLKYPEFHSAWFEKYSQAAVIQMEKKFCCQKITVFSNDLDWCKEHLRSHRAKLDFAPPDSYAGGLRDIVRMSQARVLAIANSTFSWWAAAIASSFGASIVAPEKWSSFKLDPASSLYLPKWNILDNSLA